MKIGKIKATKEYINDTKTWNPYILERLIDISIMKVIDDNTVEYLATSHFFEDINVDNAEIPYYNIIFTKEVVGNNGIQFQFVFNRIK